MNKLVFANINADVLAVRARLEEDQIAGSQAVLGDLHAAMDLFTRRARQIRCAASVNRCCMSAEQSTPRCVVPPHRYWVPFHFWY